MRLPRPSPRTTTWAGLGLVTVVVAVTLADLPTLNVVLAVAGLATIAALVAVRRRSAERMSTRQ